MSRNNGNYVYSVMPGARLYVGPKGRLEESLGHSDGGKPCCSGCASGKKKCGGGLGDTPLLIGATASANPAAYTPPPPPPTAITDVTSSLPSWAPFAIGGIALFFVVKLIKRKRKS